MSTEQQNAPSWVSLDADEELLWVGHKSWWAVGWWVVGGAVLVLGGLAGTGFLAGPSDLVEPPLTLAPLIAVGLGIIVAGYALLKHRSVAYAVTENEVYEKRGVVSSNVTQIPLSRVQNIEMSVGLIDRLLSYGNVTVRTAGTESPNIHLVNVPKPRDLHDTISARLDTQNEGL